MGGPLQLVFCYSTVNGGARDISPRAFNRSAIRPKMPARKNFITTMTRVANSEQARSKRLPALCFCGQCRGSIDKLPAPFSG